MSTRYQRQILLPEIGIEGQERLKNAHVLVVGAGGLGCPVLTYLAAAGVGAISIIDNDTISESNLNRQVLFGVQDIGKFKVEVAKERLLMQNPELQINIFQEELNLSNGIKRVEGKDVVVDCTDNMATRYLLSDVCELTKVPLVFGGIHRFEGQITVFHANQGISYRDLFPYDSNKVKPSSCNENGVLGVIPGIIGSYQANEVVKLVVGFGDVLDGKILVLNLLNHQSQVFSLEKVQREKIHDLIELPEYEHLCNSLDSACISVDEFLKMDFNQLDLIDIREEFEQPKSKLETTDEMDSTSQNVVLLCQTGKRTRVALKEWGVKYPNKNVYSLNGGVIELNLELKKRR